MKQKARTASTSTRGFTTRKLLIVVGVIAAVVLVVLLVLNWRSNTTGYAPEAPGTPVTGQTNPPQATPKKTSQSNAEPSRNSGERPR